MDKRKAIAAGAVVLLVAIILGLAVRNDWGPFEDNGVPDEQLAANATPPQDEQEDYDDIGVEEGVRRLLQGQDEIKEKVEEKGNEVKKEVADAKTEIVNKVESEHKQRKAEHEKLSKEHEVITEILEECLQCPVDKKKAKAPVAPKEPKRVPKPSVTVAPKPAPAVTEACPPFQATVYRGFPESFEGPQAWGVAGSEVWFEAHREIEGSGFASPTRVVFEVDGTEEEIELEQRGNRWYVSLNRLASAGVGSFVLYGPDWRTYSNWGDYTGALAKIPAQLHRYVRMEEKTNIGVMEHYPKSLREFIMEECIIPYDIGAWQIDFSGRGGVEFQRVGTRFAWVKEN